MNISLLDLRRAYFQVRVPKILWPFQTVKIDRKRYCPTRLGFGLNLVPLIMKAIVSTVMSQEKTIDRTASAYINDICVSKAVLPTSHVRLSLGWNVRIQDG